MHYRDVLSPMQIQDSHIARRTIKNPPLDIFESPEQNKFKAII